MVRLHRALSDAGSAAQTDSEAEHEHALLSSDDEETTGSRKSRSQSRGRATRSMSGAGGEKRASGLASMAEESPTRTPSPAPAATPSRRSGRQTSSRKKAQSPRSSSPIVLESAVSARSKKGSTKKTLSARKGSDARRADTAEHERTEAARRKQLFDIEEAAKAVAAAKAKKEQAVRAESRGKFLRFVAWTVAFVVGVLCGAAYLLNADNSPMPARVSVDSFTRAVTATFPTLPERELNTLHSAILAHAQAFESSAAAGSADGSDDPNSAEWIAGSTGLLQASKPLVIVLATNGGMTREGAKIGNIIAQALPVNGKPLPVLDLAHALNGVFGTTPQEPGAPGASTYSVELKKDMIQQVLLTHFDQVSPSTAVPSLARGIVYVRHASSLSREAALAFQKFTDDVQSPVRDVAFIFEVDASHDQRYDATTAVQEDLKAGWASHEKNADEVLLPLLSRVVRNVIDLRGLKL